MSNLEILAGFEREINKIDDTIGKPLTSDSLYWLNQAVSKFVKTRFNGTAPHYTSYEQTEKRTNDLINLYSTIDFNEFTVDNSNPSYDSYEISYKADGFNQKPFLYALNEDVVISDNNDANKMNTCIFECTADSFMYRVNNSLTDFHYRHHKARPLRVKTTDGCKLLTDKNYKIQKYTLGYLRVPNKISLDDDNYDKEYSEFPEVVLPEIIKIAAQMYIESQIPQQQRYQTINNEVNTQE